MRTVRPFFAFLLTFAWLVAATAVAGHDFAALETEVASAVAGGDTRATALLAELARKYASEQRLQEAVWSWRRAGRAEEAAALEAELRGRLLDGHVEKVSPGLGGVAGSTILSLAGDIAGVFKPDRGDTWPNYRFEVLAYELDRALGLDVVPLTVERVVNGATGSLQYFIREAVLGGGFHHPGQFVDGVEKMNLLDTLLQNGDRHGSNWLFRPGKIVVAIDHGHSDLYSAPSESTYAGITILLRYPEILERLAALDERALAARLGATVPARFLKPILARRDFVLRSLHGFDRLRRANRDEVVAWLREELAAMPPVAAPVGYLSVNGQQLVAWLQRIADATPHRNFAALSLVEALGPALENGKVSAKDFRRVLARALGMMRPDAELVQQFRELYARSPWLRKAWEERRGVFLESKQPDAAEVARAYRTFDEAIDKCSERLAAAG